MPCTDVVGVAFSVGALWLLGDRALVVHGLRWSLGGDAWLVGVVVWCDSPIEY